MDIYINELLDIQSYLVLNQFILNQVLIFINDDEMSNTIKKSILVSKQFNIDIKEIIES